MRIRQTLTDYISLRYQKKSRRRGEVISVRNVLRDRRGSGSIEFLAILPLFILVALTVWQVAVIGYGILNAQAAARDGVRVAATETSVAKAEQAARKSFGSKNNYYSLDSVSVSIGGREARVTVHASIYTALLPKKVRIPYSWTVTTPIFEDRYDKL